MQSTRRFSTQLTPATPNVTLIQQTVYVANTTAQTAVSCTQALYIFFYFNNNIRKTQHTFLRNLESYLQLRFWCMSPCRLADRCHRFRQTCSLHLQGGRRATGHPAKCHIHDTSYRDKVKCHMCAQIPGDYILSTGVNTFRIIAAAYPLMQKKIVSADMQPAQ